MRAKAKNIAILLGGLAGVFAVISRTMANSGFVNKPETIYQAAQRIISENNFNADPLMIVTMAKIESNFNPLAIRFEPALGDASYGLMQTLHSTARWLADDMGYNHYGVPSAADLFKQDISLYFGAAYVDYLSNWRGRARSEDWIVESYNGGPGNSNSGTKNHLRKYHKAKDELKVQGVI